MREVVLVRHAVTGWNLEGRIQGQDGAGLAADGREQADITARWLAASFPDAALYASDLQRCRETAAPLALQTGREPVLRQELRERDFGDWTAHTHAEVEAGWPEHWARWRRGEDVAREVGGESSDQLRERVSRFIREVVESDGARTAILVTHGGPIWHGVHELVGLPVGTLGGVGNASVTVLHVHDHDAQLSLWNQVGHLPPRLRTWFRAGRPSRTGSKR